MIELTSMPYESAWRTRLSASHGALVAPAFHSLKTDGPIDEGGAKFIGWSSMFLDTSVLLLSHPATKLCFGRIPPAPAPERLRSAGQNAFVSEISMVLPASLTLIPVTSSAFPST